MVVRATVSVALGLLLASLSLAGCDLTNVDSDASDSTSSGGGGGGGGGNNGGNTGGGGDNTGGGGGGGGGGEEGFCGEDGTCNPSCRYDADCACASDGTCNPSCRADPDCAKPSCSCDYTPGTCEVKSKCSPDVCTCDDDCTGVSPCGSDGHCDTWCPTDWDPDCAGDADNGKYCTGGGGGGDEDAGGGGGGGGGSCSCDYTPGVCDAEAKCSLDACYCDVDCDIYESCEPDGHCDSWCPTDSDPDCDGSDKNGKYCF
jgi:hypothetical protein